MCRWASSEIRMKLLKRLLSSHPMRRATSRVLSLLSVAD